VPLSLLVSRVSEALSTSDDVAAATAALTIHTAAPVAGMEVDVHDTSFPPLPSPGEEVMSPRTTSAQRRAKGKGKRRQCELVSPPI
jgi:hypothetical protein